jgi:hypothetical protein
MTNQSKLKKLFRAHAVATGMNYTRARKEVLHLLKDDPEAYHRLRTTYNLDKKEAVIRKPVDQLP